MTETKSPLGALLRQWRESRGIAMSRLAEKAGVSRMTLHRWETGRTQPRLPELESALKTLGVPFEERRHAILLIDAPRAVAHQREGMVGAFPPPPTGDDAPDSPLTDGSPSTGGDLLRAMRQRRRWTQEQVARHLGVTQAAVASWEASRAAPPEERRTELLQLLGACAEESQALREGRLLSRQGAGTGAPSMEWLEARLGHMKRRLNAGDNRLMDLDLLRLEGQLWSRAQTRPSLRLPLADAYRVHARWLWWRDRPTEAAVYAQRVMETLPRNACSAAARELLIDAIHISGGVIADRRATTAPKRALRQLLYWLPIAETPDERAFLYRDMADYCMRDGKRESAVLYTKQSLHAAQQSDNAELIALSRYTAAAIYVQTGRAADALTLLRTEDLPNPMQNINEALTWCEALIAVGQRDDAAFWLRRSYHLMESHDLPRSRFAFRADYFARVL